MDPPGIVDGGGSQAPGKRYVGLGPVLLAVWLLAFVTLGAVGTPPAQGLAATLHGSGTAG